MVKLKGDVIAEIIQFIGVNTVDMCRALMVSREWYAHGRRQQLKPELWLKEWVTNDGLGGFRFSFHKCVLAFSQINNCGKFLTLSPCVQPLLTAPRTIPQPLQCSKGIGAVGGGGGLR